MKLTRRNFALTLSSFLTACGGGFGMWDIDIPMPTNLRTDLNYCYYLSLPGQMQATHEHTSLLWHAQFYDNATLENEIRGYSHKLVLDCSVQLMQLASSGDRKKEISPKAEVNLRQFFNDLRNRGLLQRVAYLTPMDEPNLFANSEADLLEAMRILKKVAAEYAELSGVKYICIYGLKAKRLYGLSQFDIVGIDNYSQQSGVLTKGAHADLMQQILPHQQVMVIPGAAYYQDPSAFIAYAHSEPRCWGVVPFIWCHVPASADSEGWKGLEIQRPQDRQKYIDAGLMTLNKPVSPYNKNVVQI